MKKRVISALGKDQPGIVAAVTQVLHQADCNIEDTSMTLLEDHFTMLFVVDVPASLTSEDLQQAFAGVLENFQLQLVIYTIETQEENPKSTGRPWMISVSGADQTGIIYQVTQYLASQQINIRHLSSKRLSQPSDHKLFLMALEIEVPEALSDDQFQQEIDQLRQTTGLEIHTEPLEVYTL